MYLVESCVVGAEGECRGVLMRSVVRGDDAPRSRFPEVCAFHTSPISGLALFSPLFNIELISHIHVEHTRHEIMTGTLKEASSRDELARTRYPPDTVKPQTHAFVCGLGLLLVLVCACWSHSSLPEPKEMEHN
jgi:hypothetical protein